MICPNCRQYTPDQGFRCMHCDAILKKKEAYPGREMASRHGRGDGSGVRPWMVLPLALLALLAYLFLAQRNKTHAVNANAPGMELDIENYLRKGKTNIVDFYSDYCPPCKKISPLLQKLGRLRPDLAILQVDINRKGTKGIDWASPLARQYELKSIPHFKIFDGDGNLLKEGQAAWPEILALLMAAGIQM